MDVVRLLLPWLPEVSRGTLKADLMAGLAAAVLVLPQGIAYAMIAGLPPAYGLYTAMVVPVIAGLFGSSRHLMSGPTAAISVLVASALAGLAQVGNADHIALALTLTFLAGAFQLALGLARLGVLVEFISHTVVVGFTAGAAVIIIQSQLGNFLGLPPDGPTGARAVWSVLVDGPAPQQMLSARLFGATLLIWGLARWLRPHWPVLLIAMAGGALLGVLLDAAQLGVPMVGALPGTLPPLSSPQFSPEVLRILAPGALAVAVLGLVEAVSIARAIALRSEQSLDSSREFVGQGLSNMVGSFFSCYAASGSFTRSGGNYDAGARTPMASVSAVLALALIVLSVPQASAHLPIPVVAAVIMIIAWRLVEWEAIRRIIHTSRREAMVLAATFFPAVLVNLEFAVAVGAVLSLAFYLRQTSRPNVVPVAPHPQRPGRGLRNAAKHGLAQSPHLRILRLDGSLFFGAVEHVKREIRCYTTGDAPRRVLLVCSSVNFIDLAGAEMLVLEAKRLKREGGAL
jgi:SulP family sulfate permease